MKIDRTVREDEPVREHEPVRGHELFRTNFNENRRLRRGKIRTNYPVCFGPNILRDQP